MRRDDSARPKDWFEHAFADMSAARILLQHGGNLAVVAMHVQQSAEKALKGYLISRGWKLKRTHDLVELLDRAARFDMEFEKYRSFCEEATAYFFEARYPLFLGTRDYNRRELRMALKKVAALVDLSRESEEE